MTSTDERRGPTKHAQLPRPVPLTPIERDKPKPPPADPHTSPPRNPSVPTDPLRPKLR